MFSIGNLCDPEGREYLVWGPASHYALDHDPEWEPWSEEVAATFADMGSVLRRYASSRDMGSMAHLSKRHLPDWQWVVRDHPIDYIQLNDCTGLTDQQIAEWAGTRLVGLALVDTPGFTSAGIDVLTHSPHFLALALHDRSRSVGHTLSGANVFPALVLLELNTQDHGQALTPMLARCPRLEWLSCRFVAGGDAALAACASLSALLKLEVHLRADELAVALQSLQSPSLRILRVSHDPSKLSLADLLSATRFDRLPRLRQLTFQGVPIDLDAIEALPSELSSSLQYFHCACTDRVDLERLVRAAHRLFPRLSSASKDVNGYVQLRDPAANFGSDSCADTPQDLLPLLRANRSAAAAGICRFVPRVVPLTPSE